MAKGMEYMGWGNCGAAAPGLRKTKGIFLSEASRRAKMYTEYTFCKMGDVDLGCPVSVGNLSDLKILLIPPEYR